MAIQLEERPALSIAVQQVSVTGIARVVGTAHADAHVLDAYFREGAAVFRSWPPLPVDEDLTSTELFD